MLDVIKDTALVDKGGKKSLRKVDWVDPRDYPFGAKMDALLPDGSVNPAATDDTAAIRAAFAYAEANKKNVVLPGVFLISGEIEIKQPMVVQGIGSGGGYSSNVLYDYKQISGFRVKGTGTKRLRTRRNWRATSADPNDNSLSVALNVQAENVKLRNFSVFLDFEIPSGVNPKDDSPTNYGSNFDVGIFLGCRVHFFQEDIHVMGYFREAGWWFDVTHATNLPRFKDLNGVEYDNTFNISGGDGCTMIKCFTLGSKWGIFVAGGIRKPGETVDTYSTARPDYYDYTLNTASITGSGTSGSTTLTVNTNDYFLVGDTLGITGHSGTREIASIVGNTITLTSALNTTITNANITIYRKDYRGTFGFSDFSMFACSIYGTDHHSLYRRNAFSGNHVTDTAGGSIFIDGMAGNGSGMIQGMRFVSCRFATWEPYQVRLDQANRVQFYGCHIENRSGTVYNPDGSLVNFTVGTGVYSYITATTNTKNVLCIGGTTQSMEPGVATYIPAGVVVHNLFSSNESMSTTTDTIKAAGFRALSGEMDLRSDTGFGIRFREGSASAAIMDANGLTFQGSGKSLNTTAGEMDIRSATGYGTRFREGSTSLALISNVGLEFQSGITNPRVTALTGELDLRSAAASLVRMRVGSATVFNASDTATNLYGIVQPSTDNTQTLGAAAKRWSTIYAGTGTINTSDRNAKQQITSIPDEVLDAWSEVNYCQFKYNDAVAQKGEAARWHTGLIAQQIEEVFTLNGLNAFEYGLLCYDEWPDMYEKDDETGEDVLVIPAGSAYSIRADECQFLEMALMRRTQERLEARITALES